MPVIENDLQTAREVKKRVSKLKPLIDFRLFGSRARIGDADDYSVWIFLWNLRQLTGLRG